MKHLHKLYNKEDIPWVKLVWKYYPNGVSQATNYVSLYGGEIS
jgi:hypothetical protein